jgi:peptidyl-prolyl cis-trans isomerase C
MARAPSLRRFREEPGLAQIGRAIRTTILRLLSAAVLMMELGARSRHAPAPAPDPVIAKVGTQPLNQSLFDRYALAKSGTTPDQLDPNFRASLLEDLKRLKAAAISGESHPDDATRQDLELERLEFLAHAAAKAAGVYATPTDAELHMAYDAYVRSLPASEYHVAHILVATENAANLLLVKLQSHADFGKLARDESADNSKARGGNLGWIAPGKLPKDFTDAVQALKPGQFTPQPVHTPYGWHLIKLIETRPSTAPDFHKAKPQLAANLGQERYRKFLEDGLRKPGWQ